MIELIGRQGSHYTRMVRLLAHELDLACVLRPIHDLPFRNPMELPPTPNLADFVACFGQRALALATPCAVDAPPVSGAAAGV